MQFDDLARQLKEGERETWSRGITRSHFHQILIEQKNERCQLNNDELQLYDENIYHHTQQISKYRQRPIQWKYFQYLSLLFTEIYLNCYFRDSETFASKLNTFLRQSNISNISDYSPSQLNKIAFWSATGSGKTLIMHINILQHRYYLKKYSQGKNLNRIILLTPNEGLSQQHLEEFRNSSIDAQLFNKDKGLELFTTIDVIDIHKLGDKMGDKTVAVDAFEDNNLVLIDEGHRGASGEKWMRYRNRLCENGFSFEYSATFGQAFGKNSKDTAIRQEYAKCILFDYSYGFFHGDGYGKNFHILNFADSDAGLMRQRYLIACLLTFYQQLRVYEEGKRENASFNIEKPLWVFVGNRVDAVYTKEGHEVSDVLDILFFLAEFLNHPKQSQESIRLILNGNHGLLAGNKDIFVDKFAYLNLLKELPKNIFTDIKRRLFNGGQGKLRVEYLGDGEELALKIGDNEPFGLVNVGDGARFKKLCDRKSDDAFIVSDRSFSRSYFRSINRADSTINILIGAKKFTEGWNSWRVSTMGLMNVGKGEGPQIIQLFGRGVRLKGHNFSLKRSDTPDVPKYLKNLETLNIFGVQANYMEQFNQFLETEGAEPFKEVTMPVILNFNKKKKLKVIRVKHDLNFKKDGPKPTLCYREDYFISHKVNLDYYPKIESKSSTASSGNKINEKQVNPLEAEHLTFLDLNAIYLELQQFKQGFDWHNINLPKSAIGDILQKHGWYNLFIPKEWMELQDLKKDIPRLHNIAVALLKKYLEKFYNLSHANWEQQHLKYENLDQFELSLSRDDDTQQYQYIFKIKEDQEEYIDRVMAIANDIRKGKLKRVSFRNLIVFLADRHLYNPLIYINKNIDSIKVMPVALNEGEMSFVTLLMNYVKEKTDYFSDKELYLLRNQSTGIGVGFFQNGNFYPDFILWILHKGRQYINFIDPHGIRYERHGSEKLNFSIKIKEIEQALNRYDMSLHHKCNRLLLDWIIKSNPAALNKRYPNV